MFDQILLDSSPLRARALGASHLIGSGLAGLLIGVGSFILSLLLFASPEVGVLIAQSAGMGLSAALYVLILCYVRADARRAGLRAWAWLGAVAILNVAGFIVYLVRSAAKTGKWRRATLPAATCLEVLFVAALAVAPLVRIEALPKTPGIVQWMPPPPPGPPPAPPRGAETTHHASSVDLLHTRIVIPRTAAQFHDEPEPSSQEALGLAGPGVPGGVPNGYPDGVLGGPNLGNTPPPPVVPRSEPPKITRVKVGGQVQPPRLIFQSKPEYPVLARMARIEGTVRLEAVIRRDGTVEEIKVLGGHPLLIKAAFDAVSRWRYEPTRLNGKPVEVIIEFDVKFQLSGG